MKKTTLQTIKIKSNDENPEPVEIIAKAIIDISVAFERIKNSRLSQKALVLLIQDQTRISQRDIIAILDIVPKLKDIYIQKLPSKN